MFESVVSDNLKEQIKTISSQEIVNLIATQAANLETVTERNNYILHCLGGFVAVLCDERDRLRAIVKELGGKP